MAKRITTSIPDDVYAEVSEAARSAGVTKSDICSALLTMWSRNELGLREAVVEPARENRNETVRRQYDRSP